VKTIASDQAGTPSIEQSPPGNLRFDWMVILLGTWWTGGLFLDGWAHNHLARLETFFTPWHAVLYSGFAACGLFLGAMTVKNHAQGYAWRRALPSGYELSLLGVFVFGVGGVLDLTWHLLFGIERNVDALLSPTHLILALGLILTISGPLRSAWRRSLSEQAESLARLLPAILSLAYILAIFLMFTQYASPIVHSWADLATDENLKDLGLASILLQSAIFMGGVLLAMRRWRLPLGTFALLFMINSIVGTILATDIPPLLLVAIVSALTGLLIDLLYKALKPWPEREASVLHLFAFLTPLLIQGTYFLTLFAIKGVVWSVNLWMGSIVIAGIAGLLLSYILVPPQIPTRQSP
jgi:hypothetical protein